MSSEKEDTGAQIPILMKMPGTLRFTKDGEWLHDGAPITHKKIRDYFCEHLRFREAHQRFVIEVEGKCVAVEVEDTPLVVRTIDTSSEPWLAVLSDGRQRPFAADTLAVNAEGIFYCDVSGHRARILRPAWQALLPHVMEHQGRYEFEYLGRRFAIEVLS